ncbi:MAG: hypothetical protein QOG91_55 [Candidatus Parcubacteria bacterium]|jgi:hypothetical protein|nr:hypothetical protein [Candidatus Parcubacteria bacterium]
MAKGIVSGIRTWVLGVLVLVAVTVIYSYRAKIELVIKPILRVFGASAPCTKPISYALGAFDPKFGLSKEQFLKDVALAAGIWGSPIDRTLFIYGDSAGSAELKINLIYDYRQKATADMRSLGLTISDDETSYDALKAKYDSLKSAYSEERKQLDLDIAAYAAAKKSYEQDAAYWNSRGGAPKKEYGELEARRQALNVEVETINGGTVAINSLTENINSAATILNHLASTLNLNVKNYNTIGASTGVEFDEGQYVRDKDGERIDIYQYENNDQLIRILAHELGHALGLPHSDDPKAIMYRLNQSTNNQPTTADINELKSACRLQ